MKKLRAPFPWFGGKSRAAPLIWRAFGNVPNFVEPFAGSIAVLLARPHEPKVETVNDKDGAIANFWRATIGDPEKVAHYADWPVNEADLHARHRWLVEHLPSLTTRLMEDPDYFDAKIAGWWVWGICTWIGNGWCHADERTTVAQRRPQLTNANGLGVNTVESLVELFVDLRDRLRRVRVCCGEWYRILGRSTLGIDTAHGMTPCGVLLDPPYAHDAGRDKLLYRHDEGEVSGVVRAWALENGDNPALRIALCGWEGEHEMPPTWTKARWKSNGSTENRVRERIWFSPHCLPVDQQRDLFAGLEGGTLQ